MGRTVVQPAPIRLDQLGAGEGRTVGDELAGVEARLQDKLVAELRLLENRLRAEVPFLFFIQCSLMMRRVAWRVV